MTIQRLTIMTNRNKPHITPLLEIPKKIYYSISEASEYTGVEPHVLRYWETKFSKLNPKRVGGNQRKYTRGDIELLYEIVNLLYCEGYTLDGAERKLKGGLQALRAERELEKDRDKSSVPAMEEAAVVIEAPVSILPDPAPVMAAPTLASIKHELQELLTLLDS